jgi:hypothetical protein
MAVLLEATSVIVRNAAIEAIVQGDWARFEAIVPNRTACSDGELSRVGFMHPQDAQAFVEALERFGLRHRDETGAALDFVIADQRSGPRGTCTWLEWATVPMDSAGSHIRVVRLKGSTEQDYFTPAGWTYEGSLSQRAASLEPRNAGQFRFLRREGDSDVLVDLKTGREVFVARAQR